MSLQRLNGESSRFLRRLGAATVAVCTLTFGLSELSLAQASTVAPETTVIDADAAFDRAYAAEVAGDYATARTIYAQAAEAGHARANHQLGFLYADGLGGDRDVEAALRHFRAAADGGIDLALVPMVYIHDDQDEPTTAPDVGKAASIVLELSRRHLPTAGDTIMFWSRPLRFEVQRQLQVGGYYRGSIDGLIGQGSISALTRFANSSTELPEVGAPLRPRLTLSEEGVSRDGSEPIAWSELTDLASIRTALAGYDVTEPDDGRILIATDGEALIHLVHAEGDEVPSFVLPSKGQKAFGLGASPGLIETSVAPDCVDEARPHAFPQSCPTRQPGVTLFFETLSGVEDPNVPGRFYTIPEVSRLSAISISAPMTLRLAGQGE